MSAEATPRNLEEKRRLVAKLLLEKHRRQFPTLGRLAYLNFGVQGALAAAARQAVGGWLERLDELVPYSTDALLERREEEGRARAVLAEELGVEGRCLSLVENTSVGMNIALWGTPWQAGDRIVLTNHEYPGVTAAVRRVALRHGLEIAQWDVDGEEDSILASLEPLLRPPTRLLVASHVLWDTGRILPLAGIAEACRRAGVKVLVDGAQAVGVLPLHLAQTGVDYYAFTGHKWWCGPEGAGGLYVHPEALSELRSTFVGPRSLTFEGARGFGDLRPDADRFEVSSACLGLHSGLRAAIETHRAWGDGATRLERIRQLAAAVWHGLGELEGAGVERLQKAAPETGLVFFRVARTPLSVVRFLEARGVLIRTIPHADCLRVSTHYLTLPEEVERLLALLRECLERPSGLEEREQHG